MNRNYYVGSSCYDAVSKASKTESNDKHFLEWDGYCLGQGDFEALRFPHLQMILILEEMCVNNSQEE